MSSRQACSPGLLLPIAVQGWLGRPSLLWELKLSP